jgi:hypothetical protein
MPRRLLLKVTLVAVATLVTLEVALHLAPGLLPDRYLARFPMHGVEFFHPGILERTPVEGLPLPLVVRAHDGPPPHDLVDMGVAPADGARYDRDRIGSVTLPIDDLGLPNAARPERADVVLVGDSFGVQMGLEEPPGLGPRLASLSGLTVYNASVAAIGPLQERWLVENVALPLTPRTVVWFFYSGNDLTASFEPYLHRLAGRTTWAEACAGRRMPRWILPDLVARLLERPAQAPATDPLPGFELLLADGTRQPVWFNPDSLEQLTWSRATWEAHPAWAPFQAELRAARDACRAAGARFLLVYLPSKCEALLPHVARDPALVQRVLRFRDSPTAAGDAEQTLAACLANRTALEGLMRDLCASEEIEFLSALPLLEAQAARGELGYLVADTHWSLAGQELVAEPLAARIE